MTIICRVLCFLPLLFLSGYAYVIPNPFSKFQDSFDRFHSEQSDVKGLEGKKIKISSEISIDKNATTGFNGKWELVSDNSGVSAMHAILLPKTNKVLMYDATIWKTSKIPLPPEKMPCRVVHGTGEHDCWCHSVLFDIDTSQLKPLKLQTDTWCSSGGLSVDGNFVSAGGNGGGANTVRYLSICDNCDWREYPMTLADPRWYSTQVTLSDGGFIVAGGREAFSYEYIPPEGQSNKQAVFLPLLKDTHNNLLGNFGQQGFYRIENNLYPFMHLAPDGNLFIFSNNRSILLNPRTNKVVHEFPDLPGGSRNYPASGMSVLLPLRLKLGQFKQIDAEVLVCGGAKWDSFYHSEVEKKFWPALQDCGRIQITKQNAVWKKEIMPSPRVMGDIMILPTGDVLMLNGAKLGTSGWNDAEDPNFVPVLYKTKGLKGQRFKELAATTIPRMYHSTAVLLPDGKVLVAGSNTHDGYKYDAKYPTELRVEKFSPPYLDPSLALLKQQILVESSEKMIGYGKKFSVKVRSNESSLIKEELKVTMYAPAFTTHGISMNQRLLILGLVDLVNNVAPGIHNIILGAPKSGTVAPPGYYLLHVVYKGVPSVAIWVQIK